MPTPREHARHIRSTLRGVERALRLHHKALQDALEEHGPAIVGDITVFGGGTPKTPPEED
jgi:hypothetical protein